MPPAADSSTTPLTAEHRRAVAAFVETFERDWTPTRLNEWQARLPPPGAQFRRVLLLAVLAADLRRQWQAGRSPLVEDYLRIYPELGDPAAAPLDLIAAEHEARSATGKSPEPDEYHRRFPGRQQELSGLWRSLEATIAPTAGSAEESSIEPVTKAFAAPPPSAPAPLPETVGRYRIVRRLGQGGSGLGIAYLGRDEQLQRDVVVKVPRLEEGPAALERFLQTARSAATLLHANLCPIYDVGQHQGAPFLAMPFIEGQSLAELLRSRPPGPPAQAVALAGKLARAIQVAHQKGIVHRDLKPSNILITPAGEPVIIDFSLARREGSARLTSDGQVLGTPGYIAPEQMSGSAGASGPPVDIFSLGVVLFELLTDQLPFGRSPGTVLLQMLTRDPPAPSSLRPGIDAALDAICLKALGRKPEDRYRSMSELADALEGYLKQPGTSTPAVTVSPAQTLDAVPVVNVSPAATLDAAPVLSAMVVDAAAAGPNVPEVSIAPAPSLPVTAWPTRLPEAELDKPRWPMIGIITVLIGVLALLAFPAVLLLGWLLMSTPASGPVAETPTSGASTPAPEKITFLSDLPERDPEVGFGKFGKKGDLGYEIEGDHRIVVGKTVAPHGLSLHPPTDGIARVRYWLGRRYRWFEGTAALNDTSPGAKTPVTFRILLDGKSTWKSEPMKDPGASQTAGVNVTSIEWLVLEVDCPGDNAGAHAVWLEPRVRDGAEGPAVRGTTGKVP